MNMFLNLISAALYVMLFQNLIFNAGYGLSEAVRMSAKPRQLVPMAIFITYFSTIVSALCTVLDEISIIQKQGEFVHSLIFAGVLLGVYFITMLVVLIYGKVTPRTIRRIGIAAFNTLILAVPFVNYRSGFTVFESIGSGLGAGIAYIVAVLLINGGLKRLDMNKSIPRCFKGTPAMFIYTALLSLAFTGISGTSVFV